MNRFAFVSKNEQKNYNTWLQRYFKNHGMLDLFKVSILFIVFLFIVFVYLYYVNLASTRWYFLRKANENYKAVNFEFEIIKTKLIARKEENWNQLHAGNYRNEVINLKTEIVYIPDYVDLALK